MENLKKSWIWSPIAIVNCSHNLVTIYLLVGNESPVTFY